MSGITNAQLASQVSSLVSSWRAREAQYRAWIGGAADGGPEGDGRFPLTDGRGATYMVESPARLVDMVSGPAATAVAARDAIAQTEATVLAEGARVDTVAAGVDANRRAALDARDQAQLARDVVQGVEARVLQYRNEALGAREGALADLTRVQELAEDVVYQTGLAENAAFDAIAAANRAASFDPALFAPVSHQHTWDQITGKPSVFVPAAHTHLWADITDKPTTFTPSAHSHAWAEITGKPTSFAPSAHSHSEYAPALHSHDWTQITGKPDLVTIADTNLGRTGNGGLRTFASFDDIGNLPTGWTSMIAPGAQGSPTGGYGYFMKIGRRDNSNGYSALWIDHGGRPDAFVGNASVGSQAPNWARLWTDKNFDPNAKANLADGNAWNGVNRFRNSGEPGVQFLTEDEQTGMRFGPAGGISFKTNGVWQSPHGNIKDLMFCRIDQWNNSTDGYPRFFFAGRSRTYIRGYDGIEFRNAADVTTLFVREDGNLIGTGEVFAGIERWFRVRGSTGIYWENFGGGWYMSDVNWIRAYNGKHIHTAGQLYTGGSIRTDTHFQVGDIRQPVFRSGTAAPSGGADGDIYFQY